MDWKSEWKKLAGIAVVFLAFFYLPVEAPRFNGAVTEAFSLTKWYAREHVLLCLVPAFFIAGGIAVFVSQASVMKYLGARANKILAYGVASVSGSVLAVCSCTVLPLFAGIYRMGAGLGPATAFLYSGPAINVLAIILTARILGFEIGVARAVGAVAVSIIIGILMHLIYRREELAKVADQAVLPEPQVARPLWQNAAYFASMVGILVFANWARSGDVRAFILCCPNGLSTYQVEGKIVTRTEETVTLVNTAGKTRHLPASLLQRMDDVQKNTVYEWIYRLRWALVVALLAAFAFMAGSWFSRDELREWLEATWGFAKQIMPLLLFGVLMAGFLLGQPGPDHEGIIPATWVNAAVGGNSLRANLFASVFGA
ncbi:MAG: hypothetical protein EHM35_02110, partial [Planctomycetaceae bacterium]